MAFAEPLQQIARTCVMHRGRKLSYFGGCDYFRLSSHPAVLRALHDGAKRYGLNVAASRFTTGNHVLFQRIEKDLARFFAVERATLVSNGYATNLALTQGLTGRFTHALIDERSHGSPLDASEALHCEVKAFRHRDAGDLRRHLKSCGSSAVPIVLTDGMFSHDGSIAPLREYLEALPRRGLLVVDDAHGAGTLGKTGKGTPELFGIRDSRLVQTISLSKAFGVYGGAILGASSIVRDVLERSRILRGNTPLPLPLASAALKSIELLRTDRSLRARLSANVARVKAAACAAGINVIENESPILATTPKSPRHEASLGREFRRARIFPTLIRYSESTAYFRFAISSEHTTAQLDVLTDALSAAAR